jgi:hypothetical protein
LTVLGTKKGSDFSCGVKVPPFIVVALVRFEYMPLASPEPFGRRCAPFVADILTMYANKDQFLRQLNGI